MSSSPDPDEDPEVPQGTITPTGPGPLVVAGVVGLVLGWAVRPLSLQMGFAEPDVPLLTIGLLLFAAAIIGVTAYATRRTVQRNRFELAFLLPAVPALKTEATLVLPTNWFRPARSVEIHGASPLKVNLGSLVQRGPKFDQVTFTSLT